MPPEPQKVKEATIVIRDYTEDIMNLKRMVILYDQKFAALEERIEKIENYEYQTGCQHAEMVYHPEGHAKKLFNFPSPT